jgi:hypothetical protein
VSHPNLAIICLWTLLALYVGIGGWTAFELRTERRVAMMQPSGTSVTYRGAVYRSMDELAVELEDERAARWFPWIRTAPKFLALSLSCFAFGALGAILRLIRMLGTTDARPSTVATIPISGGLLGIVLLGLAYIIPSAIVQASDIVVRPISVFAICMLGGLFSDEVIAWIKSTLNKVF